MLEGAAVVGIFVGDTVKDIGPAEGASEVDFNADVMLYPSPKPAPAPAPKVNSNDTRPFKLATTAMPMCGPNPASMSVTTAPS